ncbi:MAG: O-antigen ligase family protein [Burkholderiales bacterium]
MPKYALAIAFTLACAAAYVLLTRGEIAIAVLCAISPALLAAALLRPILFPYAAYAILVPLDTLLSTGSDGTIPKVLGMLSGIALVIYVIRRQAFVVPSRANLASIAFTIAFAASLLWTISPDSGHINLQTLAELVLVYTCVCIVPIDRFDLKTILGAIVLGGVGVAIYGIWMFRHANPTGFDAQAVRLFFRSGGQTLDINTYADAMLLPIGIALWAWLVETSTIKRVAIIAALGVMTYAVLLAASRDALIAIGILLLYVAWRSPLRKRLWPFAALAIAGSLLHTDVWKRFGEAQATGGAGRLSIWHVGVKAFEAHPFFGWGGGSFSDAYDRFYLSVYQNYNAGWDRASHNLLLHYGVEMGIVGTLLVAGVWLLQIRQARELEAYPALRELAIALTGVLLALAFASLFIDLYLAKILWLAFGVVGQARSYALCNALQYVPAARKTRWAAPMPIASRAGAR